MQYSTLAQIKTRLNNECDLFDEGFIDQDVELLGYINSAIDDCEAVIHKLYEDYFLNKTTITLVNGTATYNAPSDVYAHKLRAVLYNKPGSSQYEIKRIKRLADTIYYTTVSSATSVYKYVITNDATAGVKITLYPTPAEDGNIVDIWYIRNAKTLTSDSDSCDIPEFINFIYAHVKWHVARKEKFNVDLTTATQEFADQRTLLEGTLSDMVPTDDSSEMQKDFSFYQDFDSSLERQST